MKRLLVAAIVCASGCATPQAVDVPGARRLDVEHLVITAATDSKTSERIRRYSRSLVADVGRIFRAPAGPVKVYVFDTKEALATHVDAICRDSQKRPSPMGFYHEPTRSVLCSMQWGLGWLGDLIVRSYLADDWKGLTPNGWFSKSFVSMLYNSFRTPQGDFEGLNVMSYYRPQVQRMIEAKEILPFARFFRGEYDEAKLPEDFIRKQGREFLSYLHARELLLPFYQEYRKTCAADPSGIRAIETVLGNPLDGVERNWTEWMLAADGEIGDSEMAKPFPVLGILIKRGTGAVIFLACPGSPAARAGLRAGDRILSVNGVTVDSRDAVVAVLEKLTIGVTVRVQVGHGNRPREVSVLLDRLIDG